MKWMFFGFLAVGAAFVALAWVVPPSPPNSRIDAPIFLLTGGITFIVTVLVIAAWFIPTLVALRRVRVANADGIVVVCQRTRGLAETLKALGALTGSSDHIFPGYFVMSVTSAAIEVWRPMSSAMIARIDNSNVVGLSLETVNIPKAVPAIALALTGASSGQATALVIPCRRGSELMAMNRPQAAELLTRIANIANIAQ